VEAPASSVSHPSSAATVAMAMPPSTARTAKPRRRLFEIVTGVVILLGLLLAGGICAAAGLKPTLSVDPAITVPGGFVTVHATRLPANQVGEIHLMSQLYTFPFRANADGTLDDAIRIPDDIGVGNHH